MKFEVLPENAEREVADFINFLAQEKKRKFHVGTMRQFEPLKRLGKR